MKVGPDYQITATERALLKAYIVSDGFRILQNIMESEVEKFNVALLNTKATDEKAIIAAHSLAKAAAQFYQGVINRINTELEVLVNTAKEDEPPVDHTEGLIDLGEITKDMPNFFGGDEF